ncbi:flagellar biosynthesis anti-sigma factor FlgM [Mesobacillus harenae]|uniref:flagellar biosynthesis anti-sigma factor FlgM n=1 Tax=Mesobacillus harenae TaxID=2213203 RepID=UPI001580FA12|nr:flagellar biosynthesis anti-sigma factor FlgM [Mesobacillus harenae]
MKINNIGPSGINPYKRQMNNPETAGTSKAKGSDKVEISSTAKELQQGSQVQAQREKKVEDIKLQVEAGTYSVNPKEVANSIYNFYFKK